MALMRAFSSFLEEAFLILSLACEYQLLNGCGRCMMALKRSNERNAIGMVDAHRRKTYYKIRISLILD